MYQIIDHMSVLYQNLTSDYFPLLLCLNVRQFIVKIQASDDEYMVTNLQRFTGNNDRLISWQTICIWFMPCLVTLCYLMVCYLLWWTMHKSGPCEYDLEHLWVHHELSAKSCWNVYSPENMYYSNSRLKWIYSQPYDASGQTYILLNSYNRPRSNTVHELMKRTRARCKYARRLVQKVRICCEQMPWQTNWA